MTDSGQNHEFAVKLTLQGPELSDTAASLKECKALAAMVSASQTVRGGFFTSAALLFTCQTRRASVGSDEQNQ